MSPISGWRVGIVSGFGSDCFSGFVRAFADARSRLEAIGVPTWEIRVSSLSSSAYNTKLIRDAVMVETAGTDERLALIGYSNGAVGILAALAAYPELRERTHSVVSIAGAIEGSHLAEIAPGLVTTLVRNWPGAACQDGDGAALEDLLPERRRAWLANNELPSGIAYYSLAAHAPRERVSTALLYGYDRLAKLGPHNDSQLLPEEQLITGSTLMGYVRADHWAVALPIAKAHPILGATLVDANSFPREALLEAAVRMIADDSHPRRLAGKGRSGSRDRLAR